MKLQRGDGQWCELREGVVHHSNIRVKLGTWEGYEFPPLGGLHVSSAVGDIVEVNRELALEAHGIG